MLFHTSAAQMEEILAESHKKTIILDFYAPWCAPCRMLAPLLDELSDRFEDTASAYAINVDTDTALAQEYGVTTLPTVLIVRDGVVAERLEEEITAERLEGKIAILRKWKEERKTYGF